MGIKRVIKYYQVHNHVIAFYIYKLYSTTRNSDLIRSNVSSFPIFMSLLDFRRHPEELTHSSIPSPPTGSPPCYSPGPSSSGSENILSLFKIPHSSRSRNVLTIPISIPGMSRFPRPRYPRRATSPCPSATCRVWFYVLPIDS